MKAELNMNDRVRVRLTETGFRVLDEFEAELQLPHRHRRASISDGNLWTGELWSLLQDFGPRIRMGMNEGPFVENRIEWENTSAQAICEHRFEAHGDTCAKCGAGVR